MTSPKLPEVGVVYGTGDLARTVKDAVSLSGPGPLYMVTYERDCGARGWAWQHQWEEWLASPEAQPDPMAERVKALEGQVESLRYAARGGTAREDTATLVEFLVDRLVHVYDESPNVDFIRAGRERAAMLRRALKETDAPQ